MKLAVTAFICWIVLFSASVEPVHAFPVPGTTAIGTLDFTRAGEANVFDGSLTEEMRASLEANFPGVRIESTPILTDGFLASIDLLIVTNAAGKYDDNWLTVAEQEAVSNFVENGGSALVLADPYFGLSAQNVIDPFNVRSAKELISDISFFQFTDPPHNPVASGPFGTVDIAVAYSYGWFDDLGPFAAPLATNELNGMPIAAIIAENAMAPGSGRVLLFADANIVADIEEGFFYVNEKMFLNGIHYLTTVPEPTAFFLCVGGFALSLGRSHRRWRPAARALQSMNG
jgi:hypothetical protein